MFCQGSSRTSWGAPLRSSLVATERSQVQNFLAAAVRWSGEQVAFDAGQRCTMTLIGAAPHASWSLRYRTEEVRSVAKPHSDFLRAADVTNQRVFLLTRVAQPIALSARERFPGEVQHGHPPSAVSSVRVGGTGKPRAAAAEMTGRPCNRHSLFDRFPPGTKVVYHYAWRNGPRLVGEPGSPEYVASYAAAHANRRQPNASTFHSVIAGYKASKDFEGLEPRTRRDYTRLIARIEVDFGDLPLAALDDPRVTRDFLEWRDGLAISPRQADYPWMVLMRLVSWARSRGLTRYRPPDRIERLYHADRSENIWLDEHVAAFISVASEPLQPALVVALETGQRQGDLLTLAWSTYDGTWIRLRQNKTGQRVNMPITRRLRAVLDNSPR